MQELELLKEKLSRNKAGNVSNAVRNKQYEFCFKINEESWENEKSNS